MFLPEKLPSGLPGPVAFLHHVEEQRQGFWLQLPFVLPQKLKRNSPEAVKSLAQLQLLRKRGRHRGRHFTGVWEKLQQSPRMINAPQPPNSVHRGPDTGLEDTGDPMVWPPVCPSLGEALSKHRCPSPCRVSSLAHGRETVPRGVSSLALITS